MKNKIVEHVKNKLSLILTKAKIDEFHADVLTAIFINHKNDEKYTYQLPEFILKEDNYVLLDLLKEYERFEENEVKIQMLEKKLTPFYDADEDYRKSLDKIIGYLEELLEE